MYVDGSSDDGGPTLLKLIFERTCLDTRVDISIFLDKLSGCNLKNYSDNMVAMFMDIKSMFAKIIKTVVNTHSS